MTNPLERLTLPQLECLRLVAQHKSSKEIAIELGLSSHAIDARLKRTLQNLEVATRQEAARLYQEHRAAYQPLVCETSDVADVPQPCEDRLASSEHSADERPVGVLHAPAYAGVDANPSWSIAIPFRTSQRPVNDLPWSARLAWMAIILVAVVIAVTLLISTAEGLSRLL